MIKNLDLSQITLKYKDEITNAVNRVIDSGWFIRGKENEQFEESYAKYIGTDYCIGVGNGFDALRLILRAYIELGIMKPGDEIIVPANTYIATILSITDSDLKPILIEPEIETYQIDHLKIKDSITDKTRGIMLVHLYGQCSYHENIGELCKKYNLRLIEDNAQSHGCKFNGKRTGSLGDAAAHSFYPTKNLGALGDGGAVTTNDQELNWLIRTLSNYGSGEKNIFHYQGVNSRLDEIQAAVLEVKLKHIEQDNEWRKRVANRYLENIKHPDIILPTLYDWESHVFHVFIIRTSRRDELQQYLLENKIQTGIHYPVPPHKQMAYESWNRFHFPITELIHQQVLSLPISPVIKFTEIDKVIDAINNFPKTQSFKIDI